MDKKTKFKIDHMDPLGQGVFKSDDQVFFIPKTLPGEEGTFQINKRRKGVHFCSLTKLTSPSDQRITPDCPHFEECNGCHYLHTNYPNELNFKKSAFERILNYLSTSPRVTQIEIIESPKRLGYRNRIQLHYDKKQNLIGFKKAGSQKILEVPNCKILTPELENDFNQLIRDWKKIIPKTEPTKGHIELYFKSNQVVTSWNKAYADGGFSQVNTLTNELMLEYIESNFKTEGFIVDLFGGDGNLSHKLGKDSRAIIDLYKNTSLKPNQYSIDLFSGDALTQFQNLELPQCSLLVVDPPRSGFKSLASWIQALNPKEILYISCHPATMARDLKEVSSQYQIQKISLIDLFPSTYHFEGLIYLTKQDKSL